MGRGELHLVVRVINSIGFGRHISRKNLGILGVLLTNHTLFMLEQLFAIFGSVAWLFMSSWPYLVPIFLAGVIFVTIPTCFIFKKAGRAWWEALIPVYNIYVTTIIIGVQWWYMFGFFIPYLNWVVAIYFMYRLSKRFGFDVLFTLGLVFLPFIFYPVLGYGSAVYIAPDTDTGEEVATHEGGEAEVVTGEEAASQTPDQTPVQTQETTNTQQAV